MQRVNYLIRKVGPLVLLLLWLLCGPPVASSPTAHRTRPDVCPSVCFLKDSDSKTRSVENDCINVPPGQE